MTWYVSKSASNGYAVGNDGNAGTSKAAPFLTLGAAKTAAFSSGGNEEIIINDGVYVGTEVDSSNQYIILGANPPASLLIRAENPQQVELIPGATTGLFRQTSGTNLEGTSLELRDLILGRDVISKGGEDANYLLWCRDNADTTATHTVTLTRCTFRNPAFYGCFGLKWPTLTVTDCVWEADRVASRAFIYSNTWAGGECNVNGLTVDQTAHTASGFGPISIDYAAGGIKTRIENVKGTVASDSADVGGGTLYGIAVRNSDDVALNNIDITMRDDSAGATWIGYGVTVYGNDATLSTAAPLLSGITVRAQTSGGFAVSFGGDLADVVANEADGGRMRNITVIGNSTFAGANGHGVGFGDNDNCTAYGLNVSYCDIGLLDKVGSNNTYAGAVVHKCGGGTTEAACYAKGSTNSKFYNVTVVIEDGYEAIAFLAAVDGATNATGAEFKYNLVSVLSATANKVIQVNTSQTASFEDNYYYINPGSVPANPFTYQATNYANAATWLDERDGGVRVPSVPFIDVKKPDYRVRGDSLAARGGEVWWPNGAPFIDPDKRPALTPPVIGGYQTRTGGGRMVVVRE